MHYGKKNGFSTHILYRLKLSLPWGKNRLALDRVKSISVKRAPTAVEALTTTVTQNQIKI